MSSDEIVEPATDAAVARIRAELGKAKSPAWQRALKKFVAAALGSLPWVGGFLVAAASLRDDAKTDRENDLRTEWLGEHQDRLDKLQGTLDEVSERFESLGPEIAERVESPEYLSLVRQAFRAWDHAETDDKRRYIRNVLVNSAGTRLCPDDVVRLFIAWLDMYHESHFMVVREIFKHPGITRYDIWEQIFGETPREDSAEADLYRLLIRDLSTGGVIRQSRATNAAGQFLRRRPVRRKGSLSPTMESAFEETKPYELTELGRQFVHYTMNETVTRIGSGDSG